MEDNIMECEGCEVESHYNPDNPICEECMAFAEPDELDEEFSNPDSMTEQDGEDA